MRKTIFLSLALMTLSATTSFAANPNVLDIKNSITDDAIVFPETFEQDTQKLLEGWFMRNYTATDKNYASKKDVETSDAAIEKRLADMHTVIEMPFNPIVRQYIDRYTKNGRQQVAAILGLGLYYMPIFEQALEERGLPQELKYLPVIESALDPNAVSKHGATGLWQLMLATGKGLGLECSSLVDERRDPYMSSKAAAELLKQLYDTYGDWSLAIAAYNSGPNAVNKAIRRAGGDPTKADFWTIYPYLSDETRGYVPMFIAANYVMTYHPLHNINPVLPTKPIVTDTIGIPERVHFDQISAVLGLPIDELKILNPQYRENVIPGTPEHPYMLVLPSKQIQAYIMSHDQILAYQADKYRQRTNVLPATASQNVDADASAQPAGQDLPTASLSPTTVSHKVAAGETLNSIAAKYGVQAADIRTANNLRRSAVRVGQVLTINNVAPEIAAAAQEDMDKLVAMVADSSAASQASATQAQPKTQPKQTPASKSNASASKSSSSSKSTSKKTSQKSTAKKSTTHKIQSGENLGRIAKKYGVTVDAIKKANGLKSDAIRAGAELKIPAKK